MCIYIYMYICIYSIYIIIHIHPTLYCPFWCRQPCETGFPGPGALGPWGPGYGGLHNRCNLAQNDASTLESARWRWSCRCILYLYIHILIISISIYLTVFLHDIYLARMNSTERAVPRLAGSFWAIYPMSLQNGRTMGLAIRNVWPATPRATHGTDAQRWLRLAAVAAFWCMLRSRKNPRWSCVLGLIQTF